MTLLTIDTKNSCYVIEANEMNQLQQNVASSFTLEKGTFDIKITSGRLPFCSEQNGRRPFGCTLDIWG
jgi:hypothetical protein